MRTGSAMVLTSGLIICPTVSGISLSGSIVCACMASASAVLSLAPGPGRKPGLNFIWMLALSGLVLTGFALGLPPETVACAALVCAFLNFAACLKDKYSDVRALFKCEGVRRDMYDYSRLFWFVVLCLVYSCSWQFVSLEWAQWVFAAVLSALYALHYFRAYTGRTLVTGVETEDRVYDVICGKTRYKVETQDTETLRRKALYQKAVVYMEEKKPYLDEDFDLGALAQALFSNRTYLSKTINIMSEMNFRSFLNNYRINYAADLLRRDPHLKVKEVSSMSGFSNPATFSLVFREMMGRTPSEYCQEIMVSKLSRRPSRFAEQEL